MRLGVHVQWGNQQRRVKVLGADGEVKGELPHCAIVEALIEREGIATSLTPDALVEQELEAITVCEECRKVPLGRSRVAMDQRRHKPRPWRCVRCANAAFTPEQKRERMRKARAALTPEQRSEAARKARAALTPEQRSEAARKASAALTPEQRRERMRRVAAAITPEQIRERTRKARATFTPEQRREAGRRGAASLTPEQRSERTQKANATRNAKKRAA